MLFKKIKGPKTVMISPTDACNLRCKSCWRLEKKSNLQIKEELPFDKIKQIIKECKELKVKTIDLTGGGEPFYRKDIFEVIRLVKKYGMKATLTTNGTLLDQERIERIIKLGLDDICFSIESGKENINDNLRGKGVYKKIIQTLKILNLFKEYSEKPVIRFATVITKENYKELDSLIELSVKYKISAINFSVLLEWSTNKELSMKKEKDALKILKDIDLKLKKKKIYSNIQSILEYGLFEHEPPKFCFAPWEMIFINSRGEVLACCTLASHYENIIGNVNEQSLSQIWQGNKMARFRKRIKEGNYFKECSKCLPEFTKRYNERFEKWEKKKN